MADESAVVVTDLDALGGVVQGVNVKLAKVGGVGPAKRMIDQARAAGFRIFLGCMEETTVGVAASVAVAGLVDWVDLDGNLLLAHDPYEGLELDAACRWHLSDATRAGGPSAPHLTACGQLGGQLGGQIPYPRNPARRYHGRALITGRSPGSPHATTVR